MSEDALSVVTREAMAARARIEELEKALVLVHEFIGDPVRLIETIERVLPATPRPSASAASQREARVIDPGPGPCVGCDKPAVCFGVYEYPMGPVVRACNDCCMHGNEDGWCKPIAQRSSEAKTIFTPCPRTPHCRWCEVCEMNRTGHSGPDDFTYCGECSNRFVRWLDGDESAQHALGQRANEPLVPVAEKVAGSPSDLERAVAWLEGGDVTAASLATLISEARDYVYEERDKCVALIAKMAIALGWEAGMGKHEPDPNWDPAWMNIVFIELPTGQISWHLKESEMPWFAGASFNEGLPLYTKKWDGHSTPEKYARMLRWWPGTPRTNEPLVQPGDPTVRHVVAWMRATYPKNKDARVWADEIDRVFLSRQRAETALPPNESTDDAMWKARRP